MQKAERLVKEEMERLGWDEDAVQGRRNGHGAKVRLARRLRQETTMSLKRIAARLQMGGKQRISSTPRRTSALNGGQRNVAPRLL
ncbi:MAG: hypothetical protein NT154_06880 [Verrucomicrobia bacterium]|nr:hypothetical protein [Verrucomicrobiota bacterium]